ncbi:MAG: imidazole glycerol phosphate synthase subunit HisH [Candidatus Hydrogenedentes bacterium]|nr:imidazole glycerol phosphate synthase subunit HisH [Candidatus Hydrogenedentota bacterium]
MIAIVDYGMGNLRSAQKGLEKAGHAAVITDDPAVVAHADAVVLPGVGAFKDCYDGLKSRGFVEPLREAAASGKPFLGICVGLQLLFDESEEGEGSEGLGIFKGKVVRFPESRGSGLKIPHMGWNRLTPKSAGARALLDDPESHPFVYFVHSYYAVPEDESIVLATTDHGVEFAAMVGCRNVFAVQFHPEKSQKNGIAILKAFGDRVAGSAA